MQQNGSSQTNLLKQKEHNKRATPVGLVWDTNMAVLSLFCNTSMAAVASCENALQLIDILSSLYSSSKFCYGVWKTSVWFYPW